MSDIPRFPYRLLWEERVVRSVANLTRADGEEFMALAPEVPVRTTTTPFPLGAANEAPAALREGRVEGAAAALSREREDAIVVLEDTQSTESGSCPLPSILAAMMSAG